MITLKKITAVLALSLAAALAQAAGADPAADRAARELLAAMNQRATIITALQGIERGLIADKSSKPKADVAAVVRKLMVDPVFMEQLVVETIPIYTQRFTTAELKELAAFYRSPLGQRFIASAPEVHAAVLQVNRTVMARYLKRFE